jgi:hypothetical protein
VHNIQQLHDGGTIITDGYAALQDEERDSRVAPQNQFSTVPQHAIESVGSSANVCSASLKDAAHCLLQRSR